MIAALLTRAFLARYGWQIGLGLALAAVLLLAQCQGARTAGAEARLSKETAASAIASGQDAVNTVGPFLPARRPLMRQGGRTMPRFARPKALGRLCLLLLMLLAAALSACAPPIAAIPAACASLLPDSWRVPVPGAPLPAADTVGDWISFADQQTGQLDKANDRTIAAIGVIERCEARDQAAVKRARRGRFLGLL